MVEVRNVALTVALGLAVVVVGVLLVIAFAAVFIG